MPVPISNVPRRVVYAASGTGPYAFTFEILVNTDIDVYEGDVLLTLTTDYTVTINANGTGSVTLVSAASDQISIVGARAIQRTSDFTTGGDFFANTVNDELDSLTIFAQQNAEGLNRALIAPQTDPLTIDMTLPRSTDRAGKLLAFDSNGNPIVGEDIGNWRGNWDAGVAYRVRDLVKDPDNSNIYRCNTAHTSSGSDPISTNADSAKWDLVIDATAVADAEAAQAAAEAAQAAAEAAQAAAETAETNAETAETNAETAQAAAEAAQAAAEAAQAAAETAETNAETAETNAETAETNAEAAQAAAEAAQASAEAVLVNADFVAVADDLTGANTIGTVAEISADVTTVAGIAADVTTVATNAANISSVAADIAAVITAANDLNEAVSEIDTVATNIAAVDTVGTNIADVSAVAAIAADVTTAATNVADITNFADVYIGPASSAPSTRADSSALQVGDLYFNTTEDQMKVYDGASWISIGSTVNGTSARFEFTATSGQTTFTGLDDNSVTLAYDAGYIDVYLNGIRLDSSDFTATSGDSIVLASGAALNDELNVVAYGNFVLADHYTKAETDALIAGIDALPSQSGNAGKYLTTDGTDASWGTVTSGATGAGGDAVFVENDQVVTTSYTLTSGKNASTTGPITINSGVTVTIPTGARWVVI